MVDTKHYDGASRLGEGPIAATVVATAAGLTLNSRHPGGTEPCGNSLKRYALYFVHSSMCKARAGRNS